MSSNHRCLLATIRGLATALAVIIPCGPASSQTAAPLLVDPEWLSQHLTDTRLVLLHVGDAGDFAAGHIPGARAISEENVARPHDMARGDLMLEMPVADALRAAFEARGVSDDSQIVVYAGPRTAPQSTTRIVLTLDHLGLGSRTSMLNGGMAAWQRAGKSVTKEMPSVSRGKLSARPLKPLIVDAEFVRTVGQRANHRLVDARAPVFYQGIEPTFNKSGHIPGAINIPFTSIVDNMQTIDRERVAAVFRDAGVKPGETVVAYCHVGQQATLVILAARLLGHPVMLYDGAFQDWATANRGAVEK